MTHPDQSELRGGGQPGDSALLGLPLPEAEARLRTALRNYRVVLTAPPRRPLAGKRLRVVGLRATETELILVVASELTAQMTGTEPGTDLRREE